jgi:hypothetical protein
MHAERVMETAMGLRQYCLERLAAGKRLENMFYMIGDTGREVIPVRWKATGDRSEFEEQFFQLLQERDPDLVTHFTCHRLSRLADKILNLDDLDIFHTLKDADPRMLVMSLFGKSGAMVHITVLDTIEGVIEAGETFSGRQIFCELKEDRDG